MLIFACTPLYSRAQLRVKRLFGVRQRFEVCFTRVWWPACVCFAELLVAALGSAISTANPPLQHYPACITDRSPAMFAARFLRLTFMFHQSLFPLYYMCNVTNVTHGRQQKRRKEEITQLCSSPSLYREFSDFFAYGFSFYGPQILFAAIAGSHFSTKRFGEKKQRYEPPTWQS